jgi:MFS family permease
LHDASQPPGPVAAGTAFVWRSARHASPVLDLALFRSPSFSYAVTATFLFFAGFAALLLGGVLFLTEIWHYSALRAGLAFAPGPLMAAVFAAPGGWLTARLGPGPVGFAGGVLFAIGTALFITRPATPDYVSHYLPGMLIGGAGVGLILPTFTSAAVLAASLSGSARASPPRRPPARSAPRSRSPRGSRSMEIPAGPACSTPSIAASPTWRRARSPRQ